MWINKGHPYTIIISLTDSMLMCLVAWFGHWGERKGEVGTVSPSWPFLFVKADKTSEAVPVFFSPGLMLLVHAASNANCHVFALDDNRKAWQMMQLIPSDTSCVMRRQSHRRGDDYLTKCVAFIRTFSKWRDRARRRELSLPAWNDPVA